MEKVGKTKKTLSQLFDDGRLKKAPSTAEPWKGDIKAVPSGKMYFSDRIATAGDTYAIADINGIYYFRKAIDGKVYKVSTSRLALSLPSKVFSAIVGDIATPVFLNWKSDGDGIYHIEKIAGKKAAKKAGKK